MEDVPLKEKTEDLDVGFRIKFEDSADEKKFVCMLSYMHRCMCIFLVLTAVTLCSGQYTAHESSMDAVIMTTDVMTVDICSCFFVLGGFVATFVYSSVGVEAWGSMRRRVMAQQFGNMWLSTVMVVIFGMIDKLIKNRLHANDIVLTCVEGVTGLRVFDNKQSLDGPHTLNVALWPVQSFVWCLMSVHGTYRTNEILRDKFGDVANYVILGMSLCGICLFTLFGMLRSNTNIFYANATSLTYRILEFNFGIHTFYLMERNYALVVSLTRVLSQCQVVVYFFFIGTWWSEIGAKGGGDGERVCLRLYPRNHCLHGHHAFLLRGCLLGLAMLSSTEDRSTTKSASVVISEINVSSTAVAFCWPAYLMIQLIFVVTFSEKLVFENSAMVSFFLPCFVMLGSLLYTMSLQDRLTDCIENAVRDLVAAVKASLARLCASELAPESTNPV